MFAIKALKKGDIVARDEVDRSVCKIQYMDSKSIMFSSCMQHNDLRCGHFFNLFALKLRHFLCLDVKQQLQNHLVLVQEGVCTAA